MKIVKMKKENLFAFLEGISQESELWAPVKKPEGHHIFKMIESYDSIDLLYTRTILPPKKLLLPSSFRMYEASQKKFHEDFSQVSKKTLFGIHSCDIHGLLILEQFYSQAFDDPYFSEARKNLTIIGHSCWPDEHCLCRSTNTHIVEEGYDLFFTDLEKNYLVWIGSSRGDDLIRMKPDLFDENVTDKDIQRFMDWREERNNAFQSKIPFEDMPDMMELKFEDPIWEELGDACLACGSCSSVCPTCTCYNVKDQPALGQESSDIIRCWDACTLENFSAVAGDENFRQKRSDRLKLWYTHKLQSFISKYGKPACVGCGRCVTTCPVDINIKTVAHSLQGEKVEAFWRRFSQEVTQ
ncbi:MAG: 4Fe-4S dicluster domain-containing protein [Candidatus Aminicenantes bacterium]|nr:4Fe-4S dicluster domain-containing protein [Candidatus Aminicenantes bacterium]